MKNNTTELIKSIREAFNLSNDIFTNMFLEENVGCVRLENQTKYFNSLFGKNTEYKKPLDRVADATSRYKQEHKRNNYTLSNELANKTMRYVLSVHNKSIDGLSLTEKITKLNHSAHFTPLEFKVIEYAGGLSSFVSDGKIAIDTLLLSECYNSAFFGEEPKPRLEHHA